MYYLKNDFRIKWKEKTRWLRVTNPVRKQLRNVGGEAYKGRSQPQYGTNEVLEKPYLQDGIAPQCKVDGITNLPQTTKGGRVYIPDNFTPKGFLESHTVKNYGWIFTSIQYDANNPNGYVRPR